MNRSDFIKKHQQTLVIESKKIVKEFLQKYPQYSVYEYSLLWMTFDKLKNKDMRYYYKKSRPLVYCPYIYKSGDYILHLGKFPIELKQLLNNKGIKTKQLIISNTLPQIDLINSMVFQRTYKHSKINTDEFENSIIKNTFKRLLSYNEYDINRFRIFIKNIFEKNKPIALFLHDDKTKFSRVCIEVAKKYNIPTIIFQHGLTPITHNNFIPFANESFIPLIADKFLAWGENTFKFLTLLGVKSDKIKIVGNPFLYLDILNNKIKLRTNKIIVIDQQFLSQEEERDYAYLRLKKILDNIGIEYKIYLRSKYNYKFLKNIFGEKYLIKWKHNKLKKVLNEYTVSIGFYSTALVESFIKGNKVISFDYLSRGDIMGFNEIFPVFNNGNDIKEYILNENNVFINTDKLNKHIAFIGKEASEKIFNELMSIL